jgi:hypothetical protein
MKKSIFKFDDKVFDFTYGWGKIASIDFDIKWIKVKFNNHNRDIFYELDDLKTLSFTEYTLEGFSQERPKELPKKGQIIWGRNELPSEWHIGYFFEKRGDKYLMNSHPNPTGWHSEVIEITTEDPYKDENASI